MSELQIILDELRKLGVHDVIVDDGFLSKREWCEKLTTDSFNMSASMFEKLLLKAKKAGVLLIEKRTKPAFITENLMSIVCYKFDIEPTTKKGKK
jgi:hypothetical protein